MGSIVDWLGIGIAVVGLFTSSYAGVRVGGIARVRLERRARLYDEVLPDLRRMRFEAPAASFGAILKFADEPGPDEIFELNSAGKRMLLQKMEELGEAVLIADHLVSLLPWTDQRLWEAVAVELPHQRNIRRQRLPELGTVGADGSMFIGLPTKDPLGFTLSALSKDLQGRFSWAEENVTQGQRIIDAVEEFAEETHAHDWSRYDQKSELLVDYLQLKLRPRLVDKVVGPLRSIQILRKSRT